METAALNPQILDEDIQIVRGTLAAIKPEVRRFSRQAAEALQEAVEKLDQARREFARINPLVESLPAVVRRRPAEDPENPA